MEFFFPLIFFKQKIWLNELMGDHHLGYIAKLNLKNINYKKKKKLKI
jgi:hypothetical protein